MRCTFRTLALASLLLACPGVAQTIATKKVTTPYPGVELIEGTTSGPTTHFWATMVSLCTDYVHPIARSAQSTRMTASGWGAAIGAQVAVNGDFFRTDITVPTVYGLAVGGGLVWPSIQTCP